MRESVCYVCVCVLLSSVQKKIIDAAIHGDPARGNRRIQIQSDNPIREISDVGRPILVLGRPTSNIGWTSSRLRKELFGSWKKNDPTSDKFFPKSGRCSSDIRCRTSDIRCRMNIFWISGRTYRVWEEKRSDIRSGCRTRSNLNSPNTQ